MGRVLSARDINSPIDTARAPRRTPGYFAQQMREGLLAASTAVGLEVFEDLMGTEVEALVGPGGKHRHDRSAYRWGSEVGSVTLGGHLLAVRRPGVRGAQT